jgi:hypothetical protein
MGGRVGRTAYFVLRTVYFAKVMEAEAWIIQSFGFCCSGKVLQVLAR